MPYRSRSRRHAQRRARSGWSSETRDRPRATTVRRPRAAQRGAARRDGAGRAVAMLADPNERRPQRRERVVRDLARPHEVPQSTQQHDRIGGPRGLDELGPERCPAIGEVAADRIVCRAGWRIARPGRRAAARSRNSNVTRPSSAPSAPAPAHTRSPLDVSASRSAGRKPQDPRGQDVALQDRGRDRRSLQAFERLGKRVRPPSRSVGGLPCGQEPRERRRVDGLDLPTERGERAAADPPQHVGVAPFPLDPPGRNSPCTTRRPPRASRATGATVGRRRRRARRGVAATKGPCVRANRATRSSRRPVGGSVKAAGDTVRQRDAERVAEPRRVLDRRDPVGPRDPNADRAVLRHQAVDRDGGASLGPGRDLGRASTGRDRATDRGPRRSSARDARPRDAAARARPASSAAGSSSSRRSSEPSRSRSRSRSTTSAAARRSASGASPSYMNTAIHGEQERLCERRGAFGVDGDHRVRRAATEAISSCSAGTSK